MVLIMIINIIIIIIIVITIIIIIVINIVSSYGEVGRNHFFLHGIAFFRDPMKDPRHTKNRFFFPRPPRQRETGPRNLAPNHLHTSISFFAFSA